MNSFHIPSLIPVSTINNKSIAVNISNFAMVFLKAACHANPGTERKWAWSNPYIPRHIFWKLINTSTTNNVSFWTYNSWHSPNFFISKSLQTILHVCNLDQCYLPCLGDCQNLLSQLMMVHWISPNQPYIQRGKYFFPTTTKIYRCHG